MASSDAASILQRARNGLGRRVRGVRDTIEWNAACSLRGRGPWCRNRWGDRYRAISLAEYHYLRDGNPETFEALLLERLLRPGMMVVDVGANHGLFSLEASHLIGQSGTIHAFEPAPATREVLRRNIEENGLNQIVRIFPAALGASPGTAALRIHRELSGLSSLADHDITWNRQTLRADDIVEVPITTLDDHARTEGLESIDFLKIDVEGFELCVLQGAAELLGGQRVGWIMLEVGDLTCANARVDPDDILQWLQSHGYVLHAITSAGGIGQQVRGFPEGPFSANYLAAHEARIEQALGRSTVANEGGNAR